MPVALVAEVIDGATGQRFEATFEHFPVHLGRDPLNDLRIDRRHVALFHATIDLRVGRIFVRDLGSREGILHQRRQLAREESVDVTDVPQIDIGPLAIRMSLVGTRATKPTSLRKKGSVLDMQEAPGAAGPEPIPAGREDPFFRQAVPYLEAYRAAWKTAYRVVYDHVKRLPPELRAAYVKRIGVEHPSVLLEDDFQKIARFHGVDPGSMVELHPPNIALAAIRELARAFSHRPPEKAAEITTFARRLRDTLNIFLEGFCSLRDRYEEREAGVLSPHDWMASDSVATATTAKELGAVLVGTTAPEAVHEIRRLFIEVIRHWMALSEPEGDKEP